MGNHSTKSQNVMRDHRPKKNVHWKSAEPPTSPGKPIQVTAFNTSGEVLAIKWERPYTDGGSPIIGYLVEQRRVGSPTWVKTSPTLVPYPEIALPGIDPTWRYQFRVFAQNVVGMSESSPISDPMSAITQNNLTTAPQFLNELQNATVLENEQCEFHVSVIGSPAPQINWFKDGFEIFSSRRTKIINDHGSSTLIFHQVALTDEGEIKCTATNRYGHVVTRFQLRIDAPPKIRLPRQYEDGYLVEAGEVIKLKVGIAGRPIPAISWSHNGEIVKNDGRCEITTNDKNSFLKIVKATRNDRGEYNIRAINKLGEFNASFLVTVTAKPSPPQNLRIAKLGKSVTLTWNAPDDDGGSKIGNYIVEYYRMGWDVWLKASSTRQLTATLNDLIEGSEYKFRIKAESPYGLSEPSAESQILFIPDPKRGIITPSSERSTRFVKHSTLSPQTNRKHVTDTYLDNEVRKSPIKQIIIADVPKNVELISQIYDNEEIVKELNYGASVENRNKKKEPIENLRQIPNANPTKFANNNANQSNADKPEANPRPTAAKRTHKNTSKDKDSRTRDIQNDKNKLTPAHDEYMLVLYDDKESQQKEEEKTHFDLDLKEAIEDAPPLSLSTPDLHDMSHHNPFQPLRRSASSSELLYEKVMQRFYQAVELDEAQMLRKSGSSADQNVNKRPIKSDNRTTKNDEFEFDNMPLKNEARNEVEGEPISELESDQSNDWVCEDDRDLRKEIIESQRKQSRTPREPLPDNIQYDDDYTESTASSGSVSMSASVESIEQFINSVRSATTNASANTTTVRSPVSDELETYHPRMEVRALSPYRSPEPGQATVILNKPVPLPDPDIKPKSILKRRPSNENSINETTTSTIVEQKEIEKEPSIQTQMQAQTQAQSQSSQQSKSLPSTPKPEKEKRSFLNLFSKKTTSTENLKKPPEKPIENKPPESAAERTPLKQTRQNSVEENKVEQVAVIDHYSDIVREMSGKPNARKKSPVPLYMNHQAMREAAARADEEEREFNSKLQLEQSRPTSPEINRLNINEDQDDQFMLEVEKKMNLYTESNEQDTQSPPPQPQSENFVEISVEHTKSISYAVRQIKLPDVNTNTSTNNESLIEVNSKCHIESAKLCKQSDESDTVVDTRKQDTITKMRSSSRSRTIGRKSISERRSESKSPASERKTSLSSTVLKVTRMPIQNDTYHNDIDIDLEPSSPSPSPTPPPERSSTPEQIPTERESNVRLTLSYLIDLAMVLLAFWLYVFHDARLAIPILFLIVYRQLRNAFMTKIEKWTEWKTQ